MRKICCLLLFIIMCMSTAYAARGNECIKYLCGEWIIPSTDDFILFDNIGHILPPSGRNLYNEPAVRYKYRSVDETSYIDDNTGKGKIIIVGYYGYKVEYEFLNFNQMRFKNLYNSDQSRIYTKNSDTFKLFKYLYKDVKIIDSDSFAELPLNEGTYYYTPENGAEQLKIVISVGKYSTYTLNIYNRVNKLLFQYKFAMFANPTINKIRYRSGKNDLVVYSHAGSGNYLQEFFILGNTANGFGKVYDMGNATESVGSNASVLYKYDSINLQGYNGANSKGIKRNPEKVIIPTMESGKGYTYKMITSEDFYKYKYAKSKSSKPVL